jgi:hypothetical protein
VRRSRPPIAATSPSRTRIPRRQTVKLARILASILALIPIISAGSGNTARADFVTTLTAEVTVAPAGLNLYTYTLANQADSDLPAVDLIINVDPSADLQNIAGPTGWTIFYDGGDPDVEWFSPSSDTDLQVGSSAVFSFESLLGPGDQQFLVTGLDASIPSIDFNSGDISGPVAAAVPEPSSVLMFGLGSLGLLGAAARSRSTRRRIRTHPIDFEAELAATPVPGPAGFALPGIGLVGVWRAGKSRIRYIDHCRRAPGSSHPYPSRRTTMLRLTLLLGLICPLILPAVVRADPTTFTVEVQADFELSLLGHTPLNPGDTTPFMPFRAVGDFTFTLDPSLNDPTATTVPFSNVTGVLQGVPPSLAVTLPYTLSPDLQFLGGDLTNIVRDGSGHVVSADVSDLSMRWDLIGTGPSFPVTLYTQVGLPFGATGVTIPFALGTVLEGDAPFNIDLDAGNPATDPLVAIGRDRTLRVVPEPSSFALFGLGLAGIRCLARRRAARPRTA